MAERITIISAERVRDELVKLICAAHPRAGVDLLVDTGLAEFVLPEVSALRLESDEHHRHKDVYQHSLQVLEQAAALETDADGAGSRPRLRAAVRGADARRRQAGHAPLRTGRRGRASATTTWWAPS